MISANDVQLIMESANLPIQSSGVSIPGNYPTSPIQVTYTRALTSPEQTTANAILALSESEIEIQALREKAIRLLDFTKDQILIALRAIIIRLVSENNLLRQRIRAQDTAVSGATSLANFQSRWATAVLANPMPDRTNQQARQFLKDDIKNALADS